MKKSQLWCIMGVIFCGLLGYYYYLSTCQDEVLTNRVDEYRFTGKPQKANDESEKTWNFKHCTSNSSTDCGRLE